jgi:methylphosphotriester-DNA--protein-cysteine methyltransferase
MGGFVFSSCGTMLTFDDFDAWGDAVSGASLRMACDGVEHRAWALGIVDLGAVVVQVASEGGGNICFGANTHGGPTLFVPLTQAAEHVVNGERLDEASLFAIPSGADFRIRVRRRAHAWCSIALPGDVPAPASSTKITCGTETVARLRHLASAAVAALADLPTGTPAHRAAAGELLAAAAACLPARVEQRSALGRPRLDRDDIFRRSMAAIEEGAIVPSAADLARGVGVNGRTLLRTFQEAFGISPKQYLMLRELHAVRRSLCGAPAADETVADILTRHGIWEFGRFAARYRRHFGELPSETLRRTRG